MTSGTSRIFITKNILIIVVHNRPLWRREIVRKYCWLWLTQTLFRICIIVDLDGFSISEPVIRTFPCTFADGGEPARRLCITFSIVSKRCSKRCFDPRFLCKNTDASKIEIANSLPESIEEKVIHRPHMSSFIILKRIEFCRRISVDNTFTEAHLLIYQSPHSWAPLSLTVWRISWSWLWSRFRDERWGRSRPQIVHCTVKVVHDMSQALFAFEISRS